jgi:hypothetical protein
MHFEGGEKVERLVANTHGIEWRAWKDATGVSAPLTRGARVILSLDAGPGSNLVLWREETVLSVKGRAMHSGKISGGGSTRCEFDANQDVELVGRGIELTSLAFKGGGFSAQIASIEDATVDGATCRLQWSDRPYFGALKYWLGSLLFGALAAVVRFLGDLKNVFGLGGNDAQKGSSGGDPKGSGVSSGRATKVS